MKVTITIVAEREDGTTLSRTVRTDNASVYRYGSFKRETRVELRKRVNRLVDSALNSTVGGR
jgi:hypothetical protein